MMYEEIIGGLQQAYEAGGAWGLAAALVTVGIRVYRMPEIQDRLPERAKWGNLSSFGRVAATFSVAFASTAMAALAAGVGFKAAVIAAIPIAITAIGGHHATEGLGGLLDFMLKKKNPAYVPGSFRKAKITTIMLPTKLDG